MPGRAAEAAVGALGWLGFGCGLDRSQASIFARAFSVFPLAFWAQSQYRVDPAGAAGRGGIGGRFGGAPNFWLTSCAVYCQGLPLTPDADGYRLVVRWR